MEKNKKEAEDFNFFNDRDFPVILRIGDDHVESCKLSSIQNFRPFEKHVVKLFKHKNLKGDVYTDFDLFVTDSKYFDSRESFDKSLHKWLIEFGYKDDDFLDYKSEDITIEDVFDKFEVLLNCNREYYRDYPLDIEKNLGYNVKESGLNPDGLIDLYEKELVHNELLKIFENDECPRNTPIIFKDFKILIGWQGETFASAERDGFYYFFFTHP